MTLSPYRYSLPEVWQDRWDGIDADRTATPFPEACGACGAAITDMDNQPGTPVYNRTAGYACGARYTSKPQIQNHREVWWATCPPTQAVCHAEAPHLVTQP